MESLLMPNVPKIIPYKLQTMQPRHNTKKETPQ